MYLAAQFVATPFALIFRCKLTHSLLSFKRKSAFSPIEAETAEEQADGLLNLMLLSLEN